jgi:hypothetical protein
MGARYKGIILTDHALERMGERAVSEEMVWTTLHKPDRSRYADAKQKFIYNKTFGREMVEVVASQNERKEWVVVSVWSRDASRLKYTTNQYYVRNGVVDWILDKIAGWFSRGK